jgi:hypothetical protein
MSELNIGSFVAKLVCYWSDNLQHYRDLNKVFFNSRNFHLSE